MCLDILLLGSLFSIYLIKESQILTTVTTETGSFVFVQHEEDNFPQSVPTESIRHLTRHEEICTATFACSSERTPRLARSKEKKESSYPATHEFAKAFATCEHAESGIQVPIISKLSRKKCIPSEHNNAGQSFQGGTACTEARHPGFRPDFSSLLNTELKSTRRSWFPFQFAGRKFDRSVQRCKRFAGTCCARI